MEKRWRIWTYPFEYPAHGTGDARDNCLRVRSEGGHRVCELHYDGHRIYKGKPALKGMPATFEGKADGQGAETLEIIMKDAVLGLKILLRYSVFEDSDAIIRSVVAAVSGETSHANHPFMMLTAKDASQKHGDVYGMHFVYSGNFIAETELNYQDSVRMTLGIHPDGFEWVLDKLVKLIIEVKTL